MERRSMGCSPVRYSPYSPSLPSPVPKPSTPVHRLSMSQDPGNALRQVLPEGARPQPICCSAKRALLLSKLSTIPLDLKPLTVPDVSPPSIPRPNFAITQAPVQEIQCIEELVAAQKQLLDPIVAQSRKVRCMQSPIRWFRGGGCSRWRGVGGPF